MAIKWSHRSRHGTPVAFRNYVATTSGTSALLLPGVSRGYLLRNQVCPARFEPDGYLVLYSAESPAQDVLTDFATLYSRPVRHESVWREELEQHIERLITTNDRSVELERLPEVDDERTADLRELSSQPPVVRYVNLLLREAYDARASDVHLEATRDGLLARFRVDGSLVPAPEAPRQMHTAVVSRLKAIAELDIADRRRPQDGRIRVRLAERELDLRVATVPTVHGESLVLRLLDRGGRPIDFAALGMDDTTRARLEELIDRPHGMILVTGPTGSGKTTTLYSALQYRDGTREKIITVEDPVEYELPGVTQVPVLRQAGVTFSSALRAILRQDPDVVMVGEMRDRETAEIAVQAAMTGHLVLSTLHTNDAVGAIPRLLDLGIPDYLIGSTVEGVLAQRLVRTICRNCRVQEPGDAARLALVAGVTCEPTIVSRGLGCAECRGTGFSGRTGLYELLVFSEALRTAISRRNGRAHLKEIAVADGMVPLHQQGLTLVQSGHTTLDEVLRVIQE